ncbi:MAG: uracil-DNA glycosylase family protein [Pseudomonadota bacterium]
MLDELTHQIETCRLCKDRFAATATQHAPRPVVWLSRATPRILVAGQAPGARVHASGRPFTDPSGDRLRAWMGVTAETFYDRERIAILPMAFCFPGYDMSGADLPPPVLCARTWRSTVLSGLGPATLTLLVGRYALDWHLARGKSVRDHVKAWRDHAPKTFPLPHPSWRNNAWLKKNPWFETELLPALRTAVAEALA